MIVFARIFDEEITGDPFFYLRFTLTKKKKMQAPCDGVVSFVASPYLVISEHESCVHSALYCLLITNPHTSTPMNTTSTTFLLAVLPVLVVITTFSGTHLITFRPNFIQFTTVFHTSRKILSESRFRLFHFARVIGLLMIAI